MSCVSPPCPVDRLSQVIIDCNKSWAGGLTAGWHLTNYAKRKLLTISGSVGGAVTDYPIRLTVHFGGGIDAGNDVYLGGLCRADFNDIRFTKPDGTLLDYWIDTYVASNYAIVWVEFDSVPIAPGTANFYIYYSYPSATSASNGVNTFDIFDDFERGINGDPVGGIWTVTTGVAVISTDHAYGGSRSCKLQGIAGGTRIDVPLLPGQFAICMRFYKEDLTDMFYPGVIGDGTKRVECYVRSDETYRAQEDGGEVFDGNPPADVWHYNEIRNIRWAPNYLYDFEWDEGVGFLNDVEMHTSAFANILRIAVSDAVVGHDAYIDNVAIRKYVNPEPSVSAWGPTESYQIYYGITNLKELAAGMTKGDLFVHNGTILARISPGPIGTNLMSHDFGAMLTWEFPP